MWLTRFALSRPVVTAMVFVALAVFGTIAYFKLGRSQNPPGTSFPVVVVEARYPGASPHTMEKLIVKPIEDQIDGMNHLDQLTSTAQEGVASIVAQFKLGTNLDLAAVNVQRRVNTASVFMPSDLNPPYVFKNGADRPLLDLAVSSRSLSPTQLGNVVRNQLEPLLREIPDIQTVDVYGAARREFHVDVNPLALAGANATLPDVFNAVAGNNANLPGGLLYEPTREASVAIRANVRHARDLASIPLPVPGNANRILRVGDVASTIDGHVEQRYISKYNDRPRVYVSLNRSINADEIHATAIARAHLLTIEQEFPQLHIHEIDAPADYTQASLDGVWQSLFEGIFLTAIVMMLFLHAWRNAAVVMVAIPTSILSTFIVMNLLGFHLDMMSMMGLSLIIGILVDDSIVVLENITRHRDAGETPMDAAINGRSEIGGAALAITMVDVVVFLPIAFLSGIVGEYLKEFGLVVVLATLFSLLVSFTLTPLLAATWSVKERSLEPPRWLAWFTAWYEGVLTRYQHRLLPKALAHGYFVVFLCGMLVVNALLLLAGGRVAASFDLIALAALLAGALLGWMLRRTLPTTDLSARRVRTAGAAAMQPLRGAGVWLGNGARFALRSLRAFGEHRRVAAWTLGVPLVLATVMPFLHGISFDFVPQTQTGAIAMTLTYPPGTPIRMTSHYVDALDRGILQLAGIESVSSTVGRKPSGWGSSVGGNYATLNAQTYPNRRHDTNALIAKIRRLAYLAPGGNLQVSGDGGGGSGAQIFYALTGPDSEIDAAAEKVAAYLRKTPGSVNVQSNAQGGAPQLQIHIDPGKAALLGVSPAAAAEVARLTVGGAVATRVRTRDGLIDVRVQLPKGERTSTQQLAQARVRASDGTLVPLASLARFTWTTAPTKIERLNRRRVVNVLGGVLPGYSLGAVTAPLERKLREPGFLPAGVHLQAQGDTKYMIETLQNMGIALATSFMLVYMLMVILYGSFIEPFIIMFSIPVALVGALMALAVMHVLDPQGGQSLNIISMIGIVMLFGLVAKNGILLVDYSNTLCKRGMRVRDAVVAAASTRFRPILMTTSAMVFGMLPLALGYAEGAAWRQAMGTVIIGGLLSSLILTLFLVPMIYDTWMGALERRAERRTLAAQLDMPLILRV